MKMICEVPDEVIKCIKDGTWCGSSVAEKMIANGIPLNSSEEPCEDAISRQAAIDVLTKTGGIRGDALKVLYDLPSVTPQEPCEDAISREAVIDSIHANCVYENEYNLTAKHIEDAVKQLPPVNPQKPKTEWQHDHEILKAYSDGASAVLDNVRAEMDGLLNNEDSKMYAHGVMDCLEIIDKFMAEGGR